MERIPATPTTKATADWFIGDVYYDVIVRGDEPSRIRVEEHRRHSSAQRMQSIGN